MPKTEETWMDGITTEMMEHICDNLCKYPNQLSGEQLEDKCAECKMGRFVCDILNQYNNCAKLLEQMQELKRDREDHFADLAEHEPTENAKKWMQRGAYSVEDCLRKWGVDTKGSVASGQEDTD
ncbi:MAG: hypothetical protein KHZ72_09455 [Lachnospiraceae bacterium]|nr:hypothetical protein [Lachnospiraceae bacterium]MBS5552984.1 hypothetical protein [Bacteroides sp.]